MWEEFQLICYTSAPCIHIVRLWFLKLMKNKILPSLFSNSVYLKGLVHKESQFSEIVLKEKFAIKYYEAVLYTSMN